MGHVLLGSLVLFIVAFAMMRGCRAAMWWGWPIGTLLISTAASRSVAIFSLTAQTAAVLAILVGIAIGGPFGPLHRLRLSLADLVVVLITAAAFYTDVANNKAGAMLLYITSCQFLLPYALGRWYLRSSDDIRPALRPLMICLAILVFFILLETRTSFNIFRVMVGARGLGMYRSGFTRATGVQSHPIVMGLTLLTFLPWAIAAAWCAKAKSAPRWWRFMPWVVFAGILGTVSRGPLMAAVLAGSIALFFQRPAWRTPVFIAVTLAVVCVVVAPNQIRSVLLAISGERNALDSGERRIVIDGEEFVYTGSDHRWMLFIVYAKQMSQAGLFGSGSTLPSIRDTEVSESASEVSAAFESIDNNLIAWTLAYGYVGIVLFYLLFLLPLPGLFKVAMDYHNPFMPLAGAILGAMIGFQLALFTVAMSRSYTMLWMFLAGVAVSVAQLGAEARATRMAAAQRIPRPYAYS